MTDYKALCSELHDALRYHQKQTCSINKTVEILNRTRVALDEPEPPADGEVADLVGWLRCQKGQIPGGYTEFDRRIDRAADLLERLAEPELQGELIPDRYSGYQKTVYRDGFHAGYKHGLTCARAADLLERLADSEPVGPSDEELTLVYACAVTAAVDNKRGPFKPEDAEAAQLAGLRAVLARWGN